VAEVPGSGNVAGGIVVMRVYGSDKWTYNPEKDAALIGEFVTASNFVASDAADQRLFFKHSISFLHRTANPAEDQHDIEVKADKGHDLLAEAYSGAYTQDYPFAQWNNKESRDVLFTSECRLGVKESEVQPTLLSSLNGTYIIKAILTRKDASGKLCAPAVLSRLAGRAKEKAPEEEIPTKALDPADQTFSDDHKKDLTERLKDFTGYNGSKGSTL
jgi:hypothetical protein